MYAGYSSSYTHTQNPSKAKKGGGSSFSLLNKGKRNIFFFKKENGRRQKQSHRQSPGFWKSIKLEVVVEGIRICYLKKAR